MLESYLSLRRRIDRFSASVHARYLDEIHCRRGCFDCCKAGLTLTAVEAVNLGQFLGFSRDRVLLQAGQHPLHLEGYCSFLGEAGQCRVYEERPIVCRTHGLPLAYADEPEIVTCEKNFSVHPPHRSAVLNMENVATALFAVNLEFCRKAGVNPMSRVPIDRIAALKG